VISRKGLGTLSLFTTLLALIITCCPISVVAEEVYIHTWPTQGPSGIYIEVGGCGFTYYATVTIYFDDKVVGTATTTYYGCFWTFIQVPETTIGRHTITAKDEIGITASTTFTVTKPRIVLSQTTGPAGVEITIWGTGLGSYLVYTLKFDEIVLETPLFTDETGAVELTTRIPSSATIGKHNLTLLYIGLYYEHYGAKYIIYAPTTKIIAYAEFEVTSGVATTRDIEALRASLEDLKKALTTLNETVAKLASDISALKELATIVFTINATLSRKIASEVERLEEQISSLNVKLNEARDLLESLKVELSSRISEVRGELNSKTQELYNKTQEQASIVEGLREEQATTKLISIAATAMALIAIGLGVFGVRALKPGRS
jgi:uncharacterized protein YukE